MVALATYLGHVNIYATYWYLEATADLLRDTLEGDRQYATDLLERGRLPVLEEAEEGLDRGQSNIAGLWSVSARVLQILQEGADQSRVELLQRQRRWRDPEPCSGELEQQLEAVSIGIACVLAGTSVVREILAEEGFDVRCYRGHHCSSRHMNVSPVSARTGLE